MLVEPSHRDLLFPAIGDVLFLGSGWIFYSVFENAYAAAMEPSLMVVGLGLVGAGMALNFYGSRHAESFLASALPMVGYLLLASMVLLLAVDRQSWPAVNMGVLASLILAIVAAEVGARAAHAVSLPTDDSDE